MATDKGQPTPPPADLHSRTLHLIEHRFEDWRRIHLAACGSCFYSPNPSHRFSSPGCPVLYVGDMLITVFWETFWDDIGTVPEDRRVLPERKLADRSLCAVTSRRKFRVFDSTSAKPLQAVSANADAFDADYANCQGWALALFHHPERPEGILYSSVRHKGGTCLALFAGRTDCPEMSFTPMALLSEAPSVRSLLTRERIGVL